MNLFKSSKILSWMITIPVAILISTFSSLIAIDTHFSDQVYSLGDRKAHQDIVIVGLDRKTLDQMGDMAMEPLVRARIVAKLLDAGAKRVFVDFATADLGSAADARAFMDLLGDQAHERVAFPVFDTVRNAAGGIEVVRGAPDRRLREHVDLASVNVTIDTDGVARRIAPFAIQENRMLPSAPYWLAGSIPSTNQETIVNFSINLEDIATLSMIDIEAGNFHNSSIKGKFVVFGATDLILGDQLSTPRYSVIAGCEFIALATATVLGGLALDQLSPYAFALLAAVILVAVALALQPLGSLGIVAATLACVVLVLLVGAGLQLFMHFLLQPVSICIGLIVVSVHAVLTRSRSQDAAQLQAEAIIEEQAIMIGRVLESSRDGILILDCEQNIIGSNKSFVNLFGHDPRGLKAEELLKFLPSSIKENGARRYNKFTAIDGLTELHLLCPDGRPVAVEVAQSTANRNDRTITVLMLRDIRERKAKEQELMRLATSDVLTGLANRYSLERELERLTAMQDGSGFALFLIDLDQFKEVNDTLGHSVGDELLVAVALRLRGFQDMFSAVARMGGDEFALVLPGESAAGHESAAAERLHAMLTEPYHVHELTIELGASIGIARFPNDAQDADKLMQCADVAMYDVKRHGGGHAQYHEERDLNSIRRLTIRGQLRKAIDEDKLFLYYQPKYCPQTCRLIGSEALVRWTHPELGVLRPDEFIPIAEQSDAIRALTLWCLRRALKDRTNFGAKNRILQISVNISARVLSELSIISDLLFELSQFGVDPREVTLEVTESAVMTSATRSLLVLKSLREAGFKLSLDDFGAGYSSFDYLRRLPVQELKIDRAFLVARSKDRRGGEILRGMIELGHRLGCTVVCEGVETVADWHWLQQARCDAIQGYFFGRPMTAKQFGALPPISSVLKIRTDDPALDSTERPSAQELSRGNAPSEIVPLTPLP